MSHSGSRRFSPAQAHRLDAPERQIWLPIQPVLDRMALEPGMAVADIGAGTGYFALPIARAVGPAGRLVAVDVSPEMLDRLNGKALDAGLANIDCIQAESATTGLAPASLDRVLLANVWHEVDDRPATLAEAARLLRPEGYLVLLDWAPADPATSSEPQPGPPMAHRLPLDAVCQELTEHGWQVTYARPTGLYSWLVLAHRP